LIAFKFSQTYIKEFLKFYEFQICAYFFISFSFCWVSAILWFFTKYKFQNISEINAATWHQKPEADIPSLAISRRVKEPFVCRASSFLSLDKTFILTFLSYQISPKSRDRPHISICLFNEGILATSFCHPVAAFVPDMFCNFYLAINHKIANNSATT
jgi:hypothetical protein